MIHRSTRDVVEDLRRHGRLIEVDVPLSPRLEIAEIQRRVYARGGPAILFTRPIGTSFPMVSNLFGSLEQARFLFRATLDRVRSMIELKMEPARLLQNPWRYRSAPWLALTMLPKMVASGPVLKHATTVEQLPGLVSWPDDGGPFVTLPQVVSQPPPEKGKLPSLLDCNIGMYRVQLSGNEYRLNDEIGLHYQIHRGIGVHHQMARAQGVPFRVAIHVGGTPSMTLAAVMPLPEGLSELTFAGALAGHRIPMIVGASHAPIYADADFVIHGTVDAASNKPEGPFGDHLGYYSRQHPFPWLRVEKVAHRSGAVWPFTVVGRPPQEDTTFGELIHELTGPVIPTVIPGIRGVHAVDAAGVHPLLLAIGSERYTPFQNATQPQELLTQANAILGQGQLSLAKYLMIVNGDDDPRLDVHDIEAFFRHLLSRIDWSRDLHFYTRTTMDTLDYSGHGLNEGSKVVMAARGPVRRTLHGEIPSGFRLPNGFRDPRWCMPGVLAIQGPKFGSPDSPSPDSAGDLAALKQSLSAQQREQQQREGAGEVDAWQGIPLILVVDDAEFTSRSLRNFLWVTFTRSDPAADIHGIDEFQERKHWGCRGPLLIDARSKPHHAPPLIEDPQVSRRIDALAAEGGPLARYL